MAAYCLVVPLLPGFEFDGVRQVCCATRARGLFGVAGRCVPLRPLVFVCQLSYQPMHDLELLFFMILSCPASVSSGRIEGAAF